jgi:hypothetical protein
VVCRIESVSVFMKEIRPHPPASRRASHRPTAASGASRAILDRMSTYDFRSIETRWQAH